MIERLLLLTGATSIAFGLYFAAEQFLARRDKARPFQRWLMYTLVFGPMAAACIHYGHEIAPGVIIDARGAVLAIATIAGGYAVGGATALIALLSRLAVGGDGCMAGLAGIALDFLIVALLVWLWQKRRGGWSGQVTLLLACGAAVGGIEALSLRGIGSAAAGQTFFALAWKELFLTQMVCTLLMGCLIHLQRERRRSREVLQAALLTSMDGFVLFAEDGRLCEANRSLELMTGYGRAELLSLYLEQLRTTKNREEATAWLAELRKRGQCRFESRWRRKDGSEFRVEVAAVAAPESVGGVYAFVHDITELKTKQEELQTSRNRLQSLLDNLPDPAWLKDAAGRYLAVNARWCQFFGLPSERVLGWTAADFLPVEVAQQWEQEERKLVAARRPICREITFGLRGQEGRCHELWMGAIYDAAGAPEGTLGITRDITERKRSEQALRDSQRMLAKYQLLSEYAQDIILFVRPSDGRIIEANRRACEVYGYERAALLTKTVFDLRAEKAESVAQQLQQAGKEGLRFEALHRRQDGCTFPVEVNSRAADLEGEHLVLSVVRDITERKEAEFALKELNVELEQRVRERTAEALSLYNGAPCGYHALGPDGVVLQMNDTELKWLGYQREEVEGRRRLSQLMTPRSAARFDQSFPGFAREGTQISVECEMLRKDGSAFIVLATAVAVRDSGGKFLKTHSTAVDITELKEVEARLRESEEKFRLLFESSHDAILTTDAAGRCLDCNLAAVSMFGYPDKPSLLAGGLVALSPLRQPDGRESREVLPEMMALILAKGSFAFEWLHQRADGTPFATEVSVSVATIQGQQVTHGIVRDISQRKRMENALRASEAKFRQFIEMAPIPIRISNAQEQITYLNARHVQTFGYEHQMIPRLEDWWQRAYPEETYRRWVQQHWQAALAKARQYSTFVGPEEYQVVCKDGQTRDIVFSGILVGEEFLTTCLDITQLKQADVKLRTLSRAVEFSASMVFITDQLGRVEYVNAAWEQVTGYYLHEVVGRRPTAIKSGYHPPEFYAHLWREITAGRIWRGEFCNRKKNGQLYWESAAIAPVHDEAGIITHFVAIKEDITARRQAAEELRRAKEAADGANRAKSMFLANMSHEIRTPMNAILGFSQLLLRDPGVSPQHQQHLNTIVRSGEHLLDIISDILEMARIESGRVAFNPVAFDLHLLLEDLERLFSLRAQAKNLRFTVQRQGDVPRYIVTDETKLRQVFINLLANAVKFTAPGGAVDLRVGAVPETEGRLRLHAEVQDTGIGIAEEDLAKMFEPFFQAQSGKHLAGGTGLGLCISREFVQLMGGELTVSSRVGEGSIFRLEIQASSGEEAASRPASTLAQRVLHLQPGLPPCRVLVADDADENRQLLAQLLRPLGFEVHTAQDGADAVAQCQAWRPHLVLLDLRMPVMDGYETARRLRSTYGPPLKIIVLSASVFAVDQQRAIAHGADAFQAKPFQERDLLECIKQLTGVDYVYGKPPAPNLPSLAEAVAEAPTRESIRRLPVEIVELLKEATCRADYELMLELVEQVSGRDEPLGRQLRRLVKNFDYATLQTLLHVEERAE